MYHRNCSHSLLKNIFSLCSRWKIEKAFSIFMRKWTLNFHQQTNSETNQSQFSFTFFLYNTEKYNMKSEREINSYRSKASAAEVSVLLLQITKNSHSPLKKNTKLLWLPQKSFTKLHTKKPYILCQLIASAFLALNTWYWVASNKLFPFFYFHFGVV